jgi:hypothetical protein
VRFPISRKIVPETYVDVAVADEKDAEGIFDVTVPVGVYTVVVARAFRNLIFGSTCPRAVNKEDISVLSRDLIMPSSKQKQPDPCLLAHGNNKRNYSHEVGG